VCRIYNLRQSAKYVQLCLHASDFFYLHCLTEFDQTAELLPAGSNEPNQNILAADHPTVAVLQSSIDHLHEFYSVILCNTCGEKDSVNPLKRAGGFI